MRLGRSQASQSILDQLTRIAQTSLFEKIVSTSVGTTAKFAEIVAVEGTSGPVTIQAPPLFTDNCAPKDTFHFAVVDADGGAATKAITVNGNGKLIAGAATVTISSARGGAIFFFSVELDEWVVFFTTPGGGAGAVAMHMQVFLANGTWNNPTGNTVAQVIGYGGGGGGGGGAAGATAGNGGGGGAGALQRAEAADVTGMVTVAVTVGAGGAGGAAATSGSPGTESIFASTNEVRWRGASGGFAGPGTGDNGANGGVPFTKSSGANVYSPGLFGNTTNGTFDAYVAQGGAGGGNASTGPANGGQAGFPNETAHGGDFVGGVPGAGGPSSAPFIGGGGGGGGGAGPYGNGGSGGAGGDAGGSLNGAGGASAAVNSGGGGGGGGGGAQSDAGGGTGGGGGNGGSGRVVVMWVS